MCAECPPPARADPRFATMGKLPDHPLTLSPLPPTETVRPAAASPGARGCTAASKPQSSSAISVISVAGLAAPASWKDEVVERDGSMVFE